MKTADLARRIHARLVGDPQREIRGVALPEEGGDDRLVFLFSEKATLKTPVGAVVAREARDVDGIGAWLLVDDPRAAMVPILALFRRPDWHQEGISPLAWVSPEAQVAEDVSIGPFAVIEAGARIGAGTRIGAGVFVGPEVEIGEACLIYPGVYLGRGTKIGHRVRIEPGAVIGREGFGFVEQDGRFVRIPQVGRVVIEDDCEIGANTCIDRATVGETRIGRGTKIDNLVQIGHNVRIGPHTVIAGQTGIAGSVTVGHHVLMGGQVGIADHLKIGDRAVLTAKAGIISDVPPGEVYSGPYARPRAQYLRAMALFFKLPDLFRRLKALEKRLKEK